MEVFWIVLGVVVLLATLLDVFLTVLNYDEAGLFVHRIVRWEWLLIRAVTRRMGRRWRPVALRQVTGLLVVTTILWWVSGIILGFSLIYFGAITIDGALQISTGVSPDYLGALYLSVGQFSTVGVDNISPGIPVLNLLTVSEAMVNALALSFIIAFVSNVFGVVQSLRALSANFFRAGHGVVDPIDTLVPYFPDGQARGLDGQLGSIADSLSAYSDGLAQNPVAYYFQSGRDQFSLPFSLYMSSGVVGALRWGLPTGSDATKEPGLLQLTEQFEDFRLSLLRMLRRAAPPSPVPVSAEQFATAVTAFEAPGPHRALDTWVVRFLTVDRRAAALIGSTDPIDPDDAYRRYVHWLPFDFQAQSLLAVVSRDLDYQPVYRGIAATPDGIPLDEPQAFLLPPAVEGPRVPIVPAATDAGGTSSRRPNRLLGWLRRRHLFIDPGFARLTDALRTLVAVALALGIALPVAELISAESVSAATVAAMVALFSTPSVSSGAPRTRLATTAISLVPVALAVVLGSLVPRDPVVIVVAMALVATVAVWMRRFGRIGMLGQLGFMVFYFSLLVGLQPGEIPTALVAAIAGLFAGWLAQAIPGPSLGRQVDGGIAALYERVGVLVDTMVDLVSTGRQDRRLVRTLRAERAALERTVDALTGPVDRLTPEQMSPERVRTLRVRVLDVQLAAENLLTLLPAVSSVAITVEERARLAADLEAVRREVVSFSSAAAPESKREEWHPPPGLTADVRRILLAVVELRAAADRLRRVQLADDAAFAAEAGGDAGAHEDAPAAGSDARTSSLRRDATRPGPGDGTQRGLRSTDKQAAQAGFAIGLALFLGSLVSTTHQYWAAMPAFQTIQGSDGETRVRAIQRIIATIAASGIAFGLAIVANHSAYVAFPLLIVSVFFMAFSRSVAPAWMGFWITLLLATMYDVLGTLSVETVQIRLIETAIGAVVAIVVSALVLPTRTGTRVLAGMDQLVDAAGSLIADMFAPLVGGAALSRATIAERERDLAHRITQLENLARPLRRNPGSLRTDGIEAQLTALWALLHYERNLGRSLSRVDASAPDSPDWGSLLQGTQENVQAVRDVLAGRLPDRLHLPDEFPADAAGEHVPAARAAIQLTRVNQVLLALIDAIRPGTVDATTRPDPPAEPEPARPRHRRTPTRRG